MVWKIAEIARRAGAIVREADHIEVRSKTGPADLVTQYDFRVERFVQQELAALCPQAQFLGEESAHAVDASGPLFIVDPIDGTTNFIRGFRQSAVSICYCEGGERLLGVIYDPYADELFTAEKGKGAFCNGRPIRVSDRPLEQAISIYGTALYNRKFADATFALARRLFDRTLDVRRFGAAVLDLCHVAAGRAEVFCECLLSPWDFAAGTLLVQEAGGFVSDFSGAPMPLTEKSAVFCTNAACAGHRAELVGDLV